MFKRLLIANRGEIACRIIKTAKKMGLHCIAIYSEADQHSLHVALADEAHCVGPAPSSESYLNQGAIIKIAQQTQADAIHPGYGFLSENADFVNACEAAKLIFVGPSAKAITDMGAKDHAKAIMQKAGVPIIKGYFGDNQAEDFLQSQANDMGYPLLIKAAAGGGGRGMRIVERADDFLSSLHSAKREALASFSDDTVLLEQYLVEPRHIEIQVFADQQGNGVYLFERDCSIQRRHQKIIEEAPAPGLSDELRQKMGETALKAIKAINYTGAGTLEFLVVNHSDFYFMEMNTRLQVEHPITEWITGYDLVEWQLRVAAGESLPVSQADIKLKGHAIEVRIYAENPEQDFLPASGKLTYLKTPQPNQHVRIDTGVRQGDVITPYYDPMIAKLSIWDKTREQCLTQLDKALNDYQLLGLPNNLNLLRTITHETDFVKANYTTHYIAEHQDDLLLQLKTFHPELIAMTAFALVNKSESKKNNTNDKHSPWQQKKAWQLNLPAQQTLNFICRDQPVKAIINFDLTPIEIDIISNDKKHHYRINNSANQTQNNLNLKINNKKTTANLLNINNIYTTFSNHLEQTATLINDQYEYTQTSNNQAQLCAPMPGTVVAIHAEPNTELKAGDPIITVEAMKMEHTISAPYNATLEAIHFNVGDLVDEGVQLCDLGVRG